MTAAVLVAVVTAAIAIPAAIAVTRDARAADHAWITHHTNRHTALTQSVKGGNRDG